MVGAIGQSFLLGLGGETPNPSFFSSINADGYSAAWASGTPPTFTPDTAPQTVAVSQQGFDATGAAVTVMDNLTLLRRKRQAYPSNALNTASDVAFSMFLLSTSTIAGTTNNSALVSPVPVSVWMMPGRSLIGNSLYWEISAFHCYGRNGQQVAAVQVRATDGTNTTAWQTVSTPDASTFCEDANPIEVFSGSLDVTGLNTGLVTLQGRVFPFIGANASIADSANSSDAREFSPRYFYKDVARAAAPPLSYVASTGNDSTGVWSTTAATAAGAPFLTVGGAMQAMNDAIRGTPATGGFMDGCRIRVVDSVSLGAPTTTRTQYVAAPVIERAPGTARTSAILNMSAAFRARLGVGTLIGGLTEAAVRFYDVSISRTVGTFFGETGTQLNVQFHNVAFQNNNVAGTWLANSHDWFFGMTLIGFNANLGATTLQHRLMRGLTCDFANGNPPEGWITIGCNFDRVRGVGITDATKGAVWYNNKYTRPDATTAPLIIDTANAGETIAHIVALQNLIEVTHTTMSTPSFRPSSDTPLHGNTAHSVIGYNTATGYGSAGRWNILYDNSPEVRTHTLHAIFGNILPQFNSKGDVFTQNPIHIGQLALAHGVGCEGNIAQFQTNSAIPDSEMQTFPGLNCSIGTSSTSPLFANSAIWLNYQGTTGSGGTPVAGAGGGDYNLAVASPAIGRLSTERLGRDIAGVTRSRGSAGCYA